MHLFGVVLELYNLFAVWATLADKVLACRVSDNALRSKNMGVRFGLG